MSLRKRTRRELLTSGAVLGTTLPLAGCSGDGDGNGNGGDGTARNTGQTTTNGTQSPDVTLGALPVFAHAAIYVADEMGYYDEYDLNVEIQNQSNVVNIISFVSQGELDIGGGGPGASYLNAANNDLPIEIVAPLHEMPEGERGPGRLVARKRDDSIGEVGDLEGKRVAVLDLGSTSAWHVSVGLQESGLSLSDVDVRTMPFPDMIPALQNESIDAAHLPAPLGVVANNNIEGGAQYLIQNLNPGALATTVFFNQNWASDNPGVATDFAKAHLQSARKLHENWKSDEILEIVSEYMEIPVGPLQGAAAPYLDPNLEVPEEDLTALQEFFIAQDEVDYAEPLPYDELANDEYVDRAIDELGEF